MNRILAFLARTEHRIYQSIVPPDLVIRLSVPIEVAIERNQSRQKEGKESEAYVRRRHAASNMIRFPKSTVYELDTNKPLEQTICGASRIVWEAL